MRCPTSRAHATAPPRSGALPPEITAAFRSGVFAVAPHPAGLATSASTGEWRVPIILVGFPDDTLTYRKADFDHELFDTTRSVPTGSVYDYYQWASLLQSVDPTRASWSRASWSRASWSSAFDK